MKTTKPFLLVAIITMFVVPSCDNVLLCTPEGLELTEQSGHLTYYFPARDELGTLQDGTYTGKILCGRDMAQITVEVADNTITDCTINYIVISKYIRDQGLDSQVKELAPQRFLEAQCPQFDAVTGATGSTHLFKICATRALWKAAGKDDPMTDCAPFVCR